MLKALVSLLFLLHHSSYGLQRAGSYLELASQTSSIQDDPFASNGPSRNPLREASLDSVPQETARPPALPPQYQRFVPQSLLEKRTIDARAPPPALYDAAPQTLFQAPARDPNAPQISTYVPFTRSSESQPVQASPTVVKPDSEQFPVFAEQESVATVAPSPFQAPEVSAPVQVVQAQQDAQPAESDSFRFRGVPGRLSTLMTSATRQQIQRPTIIDDPFADNALDAQTVLPPQLDVQNRRFDGASSIPHADVLRFAEQFAQASAQAHPAVSQLLETAAAPRVAEQPEDLPYEVMQAQAEVMRLRESTGLGGVGAAASAASAVQKSAGEDAEMSKFQFRQVSPAQVQELQDFGPFSSGVPSAFGSSSVPSRAVPSSPSFLESRSSPLHTPGIGGALPPVSLSDTIFSPHTVPPPPMTLPPPLPGTRAVAHPVSHTATPPAPTALVEAKTSTTTAHTTTTSATTPIVASSSPSSPVPQTYYHKEAAAPAASAHALTQQETEDIFARRERLLEKLVPLLEELTRD